jgi:regulation of enolase protein 1 (concanavalin A-like superfamily)
LRDVEGDFAVQVRVGGDFQKAALAGEHQFRRAGLLVTDGKTFARVQRTAYGGSLGDCTVSAEVNQSKDPSSEVGIEAQALRGPVYLRLERRTNRLLLLFSRDGKRWDHAEALHSIRWPRSPPLPRKVKVGVVAESTAAGQFRVTFDQLLLNAPPRKLQLPDLLR